MTTTKKKRRKKSVKKLKYSNKKLNFVHVATLAGVILILLVIILAARGCGGISPRTPEGLVESYIKIDFRLKTGTSTIFAYEDRGKYYLEQPYQGIYKIDRKLFERLKGIE